MIVGIDNGKAGFLALYDPQSHKLQLATAPVKKGSNSPRQLHAEKDSELQDYDIAKLSTLLRHCKLSEAKLAIIEEPMLRNKGKFSNARSMGDLCRACGMYEALCAIHGIRLLKVNPMSWKSHFKLTKRPKEAAIDEAKLVWPQADFPTPDAADAALLAYYAKEKGLADG